MLVGLVVLSASAAFGRREGTSHPLTDSMAPLASPPRILYLVSTAPEERQPEESAAAQPPPATLGIAEQQRWQDARDPYTRASAIRQTWGAPSRLGAHADLLFFSHSAAPALGGVVVLLVRGTVRARIDDVSWWRQRAATTVLIYPTGIVIVLAVVTAFSGTVMIARW